MTKAHNFHIPVMGIGFTLDTPYKVSSFGIDSVVSIVDDQLIESLRKMYCEKFERPYKAISEKIDDFRAKRITGYLNLLHDLSIEKLNSIKECSDDSLKQFKAYIQMLPDSSSLKKQYDELINQGTPFKELKNWINDNLALGSIDVNIMTKLDRENYHKGTKLPDEYNDAHAALRGFALSKLESSLVLSAGMNPRLYGYLESFDDFYPNEDGFIKKKIVIKVSDFRSALIQGKFLAKKGLWVSEYRIESGLNCGGHAFATEGYLMGPILEEFKNNREELLSSVEEILKKSLTVKQRPVPKESLPIKITAQGGVGTNEEHQFLIDHYGLDSVGWGSPFLLVPEATTVDTKTMEKLMEAEEKDLYLSDISPLGVPFNNLRGNTKDLEKMIKADTGKPGSPCPKEFLALQKGFGDIGVCTASRQYQRTKIKELEAGGLTEEAYKAEYQKIIDKSCICVGLGQATTEVYDLKRVGKSEGVSICPGPNMAYFDKTMSLKEITDHIYGRNTVIKGKDRPHMFIKELGLYMDYLKNQLPKSDDILNKKQEKYFASFCSNMREGIAYYETLFDQMKNRFDQKRQAITRELNHQSDVLENLKTQMDAFLAKGNSV